MVHDLRGEKDPDLVQGLRGGQDAGSGAGSIVKVLNQDRTLSERRRELVSGTGTGKGLEARSVKGSKKRQL
jgi:hypothetical protein